MGNEQIEVSRDRGVATIQINRPERKNALTPEGFEQLAAHFEQVAANPDDRVVVLTGTANAFCSGADLSASPETLKRITAGPVAPLDEGKPTRVLARATVGAGT